VGTRWICSAYQDSGQRREKILLLGAQIEPCEARSARRRREKISTSTDAITLATLFDSKSSSRQDLT
jgi:hypothetical protein